MKKRLYKSRKDKMIAGVCGGIAEYFKIDPTIVRVLMVLLALSAVQVFVIAYIIAAIIVPEKPKDYVDDEEDVEILDRDGNTLKNRFDNKQILGGIFVGAGALMIINKTVSWFNTDMLLAIVIIGIGVYVLFQNHKSNS